MATKKHRRFINQNQKSNFNFYLTNAFGKGREHYGLQISEDKDTWSFLVLTHTPTVHYKLKHDPLTGKDCPSASFIQTSIKTFPKGTRLRMDTNRKLSKEDEEAIKRIIKQKKPLKGN